MYSRYEDEGAAGPVIEKENDDDVSGPKLDISSNSSQSRQTHQFLEDPRSRRRRGGAALCNGLKRIPKVGHGRGTEEKDENHERMIGLLLAFGNSKELSTLLNIYGDTYNSNIKEGSRSHSKARKAEERACCL